jgi:toxin ParE1/3/4
MVGHRPPVIWSPEAEADLTDIWNHFAGVAGSKTADTLVRAIAETCRMLEEHPLAGRSRDEIRPGIRSALASPFVIFYRVTDNVAEIVRVLDGRRDIDEIFD